MSLDIFLVFDQFITHELLEVGADALQFWHSIDDVGGEMIPIKRVHDGHVERRRGRALFLIPANVKIRVAVPAISQAVYQPRVSVIGEHDRFIRREHGIEFAVRQTVRVLARRLQCHQVHDVHHPDLDIRKMLTKKIRRSESF